MGLKIKSKFKAHGVLGKFLMFLALVVAPVGLFATLIYFAYYPQSTFYGKVFSHAQTAKKVIALSFDDGPNGKATSEVLSILKSENVSATFFLVGDNVSYYPDLARQIAADGNEIANHTLAHTHTLPFTTEGTIISDLLKTNSIIKNATGKTPLLFRPPYGLRTPWLLAAARAAKLTTVTWNDLASDYNPKTSAQSIDKIILARVHPGTIITLHDGVETKHGADRSAMLKALPIIIENLKSQGYSFVTVGNLISGNF